MKSLLYVGSTTLSSTESGNSTTLEVFVAILKPNLYKLTPLVPAAAPTLKRYKVLPVVLLNFWLAKDILATVGTALAMRAPLVAESDPPEPTATPEDIPTPTAPLWQLVLTPPAQLLELLAS